MKKLFTIILLLFALNIQAQDFGAIGSEWYYGYLSSQASSPAEATFFHLKSVADTVYAGKQAKLIDGVSFTDSTGNAVPFVVYQQGDTAYYYSHFRGKYVSMYIFNRNPGDTIELDNPYLITGFTDSTYKERIDSVTIVTINGVALKKYHTTSLGSFFWIEGGAFIDRIGSVSWFHSLGTTIATGSYGPLRCFSDGVLNVNFTNRPCNAEGVNSSPEILKENQIQTYPNPFKNRLTITIPSEVAEIRDITFHNLQGQKVYSLQVKIAANEIHLDMPELPVGLYFMRISSQNESYFSKVLRE